MASGALLLTRCMSYNFQSAACISGNVTVASLHVRRRAALASREDELHVFIVVGRLARHELARLPCLPAAVRALPDSAATGGRAC